MKQACDIARRGIQIGQSPFGAVIVQNEQLVCEAHNTVWRDTDPTAHAEMNALRSASRRFGSVDLKDCTLYSTCEPCPMCLSAIHWANLRRVVYGATIEDAARAGFRELFVPAKQMVEMGKSRLVVEEWTDKRECVSLFQKWKSGGSAKSY